jgi:hypothetical protein
MENTTSDTMNGIIGLVFVGLVLLIPIILKLVFKIGAKPFDMKNLKTGQTKTGFYGFSWTYLLFGWWVPLLRGELGVAALHLLFSIFTLGIWQVIVSFMFNKQYTNRKITEGYRFADSSEINAAAAQAVGVDLNFHEKHPI